MLAERCGYGEEGAGNGGFLVSQEPHCWGKGRRKEKRRSGGRVSTYVKDTPDVSSVCS